MLLVAISLQRRHVIYRNYLLSPLGSVGVLKTDFLEVTNVICYFPTVCKMDKNVRL